MANRKGTVSWVPIDKIKAVGWGGGVLFVAAAVLSQVNEDTLAWAGTWQAPLGAGVTALVALIAGYLRFDPDVFQKSMPGFADPSPAGGLDDEFDDDDEDDDDDGDPDEGDDEDGDPDDDEIAEDEDGEPNRITEDV